MTIFHELLAIKRYREQRAAQQLQQYAYQLEQAKMHTQECTQAVLDFTAFAQEKEGQLYAQLYQNVVKAPDLDYTLACVAHLRTQQDELRQQQEQAEQAQQQAQESYNRQRALHQESQRHCEKFVELAQARFNAALHESDRQEELELEEVATLRRDSDEWSNHEEVELA